MQLWTITGGAGEVLAASFPTPSSGSHPKDNGWAWNAATQRATRIDGPPDLSVHRWAGGAWVDDLDALRARRWEAIKAARDTAVAGGCATPLGAVDTDPASQLQISGAVQLAQIAAAAGQPFSIDWTMQDNRVVTHDGPAMIAMGVAVGEHVAACYAAGRVKREAIGAAATRAAIESVETHTEWPA